MYLFSLFLGISGHIPQTHSWSGSAEQWCSKYGIRRSTRVTVSKVLSLLSHGRACPRHLPRWGWFCPAKTAENDREPSQPNQLVFFEASNRNISQRRGRSQLFKVVCSECPSSSSLCGGGVLGGGLTKCRWTLAPSISCTQRSFLKHLG